MGLIDFVIPLALTLLLEGMIALLWGLRRRSLLLFVLANVLTNPVVVLLHALFPYPAVTLLLEAGAVVTEALCYSRLDKGIRRPWIFSLIANLFSVCVGFGIDRVL